MTIETATPSSAETIAALFDNLDARFAMLLESADFEDKVEACVQTAVDNLDLHDQVLEIAQDLTFEVSVSR